MNSRVADQAKGVIRERIWTLLEHRKAAPSGVHGSIPAFYGAQAAADRLAELPAWKDARVVKAVPDKAQFPARVRALAEGKLVYMAVPRLAAAQPFYLLDPETLTVPVTEAATSKVAAAIAPNIGVSEMRPVDLIVCGSVAVNHHGVRLGKGAGYSDIEFALLQEAGLIGSDTTIVTTVHSLQVMDEELPETDHDFSVDLIVTPNEIIECGPPRRPLGLVWEHLEQEKIESIPLLKERRSSPSDR
ncbi:5-formyltetrahydrofolate cyclo-ligase [Nocardia carnea]|uniref:5-formyltetrahydrofolate cyclo-ligase n=1 Tax=Nocardia carnea TaxID=37328 RepID=UPI002458E827|nr:5-formyltetrahydrofolate cyclo-ligase [Nocardia carnea]